MSRERELLSQALEQMELAGWLIEHERTAFPVMDRIRAELAKPEPEPFGYVFEYKPGGYLDMFCQSKSRLSKIHDEYSVNDVAVYTHPPRQQDPLSEEEINRIILSKVDEKYDATHQEIGASFGFARAIERAHGIGGEK